MILSIGEILIDSFKTSDSTSMCVGGAPFNVAVGAKRTGVKVGFIGKVGDDVYGNFILDNIKKYTLDYVNISIAEGKKTTIAEVTLASDGERFFKFLRDDTADYQLTSSDVDLVNLRPTILHIGTLMLSEEMGRNFASKIIETAKESGVYISCDVNFRDDIFESKSQRNCAMKSVIETADFLKMSVDEILDYTGASSLENSVKTLGPKGVLFVTDSSNGSHVYFENQHGFIPAKKVEAVDTTGAGDAFWGTALAGLDKLINSNTKFTLEKLIEIAEKANLAGAKAVTKVGAI